MTQQPRTPTERGDWIDALHEDANGLVWTTKAELRAERADLLAQIEKAVDVAKRGLEVLHSPHYGWGCNAANCSGQEALDLLAAIRSAAPVEPTRTDPGLRAEPAEVAPTPPVMDEFSRGYATAVRDHGADAWKAELRAEPVVTAARHSMALIPVVAAAGRTRLRAALDAYDARLSEAAPVEPT